MVIGLDCHIFRAPKILRHGVETLPFVFDLQTKSEKDRDRVKHQIEETREKLDAIVPKYEQLKEREQHSSAQYVTSAGTSA